MKSDLNNQIIGFFRECYVSDNRGTQITNIFSRKVKELHHIQSSKVENLMECEPICIPHNAMTLIAVAKEYKREKKIIFASEHIVINVTNNQGKLVKYAAPLRYTDITVSEHKDGTRIICDPNTFQWNIPVLREIIEGDINWDELDLIMESNEDKPVIERLHGWFAKHRKDIGFELFNAQSLQEFKGLSRSRAKSRAFIVNCGTVCVVDRSVNTRGIIHELEKLEQEKKLSLSLKQMLSGSRKKLSGIVKPDFGNIPGVLSEAQERILINAATRRLSQVIGPPGTGKSYTIANIAIDRFLKGEKVLVVSQNEHAINVVQKQLTQKLGVSSSAVVRAGGSLYHKQLKKVVGDLLKDLRISWQERSFQFNYSQVSKTIDDLKDVKSKIYSLEKEFLKRSNAAVSSGIDLDTHLNNQSFWKFFYSFKVRSSAKRVERDTMLHETIDELHELYKRREKLVAELINRTYDNRLKEVLTNYRKRKDIVKFHSALKARNSARQQQMFNLANYDRILEVLPIWLSSLEGLYRALPLQKDLFDVVIIDEATQCDIASCLPAIQRAKRVVVVGDPNQLRHISFLSRKKQESIRKKYGLETFEIPFSFRDDSMIDMINHNLDSSEDVVMLEEHYRSLPEIIQFSNKKFYREGLRIMTERPLATSGNPVSIVKTEGTRVNGKNLVEANALISYLKDLIERQSELPEAYKLSIGILSFFRDQAELLQEKLLDIPSYQIAEHQLRAGTPYSFQGEERDIMLISCAIDNDSNGGTYNYLNNENMFNVAITRAKSAQVLFLSTDMEKIPKRNLLHEYIKSFEYKPNVRHERLQAGDDYIKDLADELRKKKIKLIQNYSVAGVLMDLVAIYKGNCLAIDLIGFPGEYEDAFHLNRYKIFDRAGFSIFPISLEEWKYRRKEVLDRISKELNNKVETEKIQVTPESLSDKWPMLLRFNPLLAKEVRLLEMDLFEVRGGQALKQLGHLVEAYHKFTKILLEQLSDGEHTFIRYKEAADSVLEISIDNYKKMLALDQSTPSLSEDDVNNPIVHLAKEQKILIDNLLKRNKIVIDQLKEMTVGWSRITTKSKNRDIDSLLNQLKSLNNQIKHYDN